MRKVWVQRMLAVSGGCTMFQWCTCYVKKAEKALFSLFFIFFYFPLSFYFYFLKGLYFVSLFREYSIGN